MSTYVDKVLGLGQGGAAAGQRQPRVREAPVRRRRELEYVDSVRCGFCRGSGAYNHGGVCGVCRGKGRVKVRPPVVWCLKCRGTGREHNSKLTCLACRGAGHVSVREGAGTCPHCQ